MIRKLLLGTAVISLLVSFNSFGNSLKIRDSKIIEGELLLKLAKGSEKEFFKNTKNSNLEIIETIKIGAETIFLVRHSLAFTSQKLIQSLSMQKNVKYVEPNYLYSIDSSATNFYEVNDPRFQSLWGLQNTGNNEPSGSDPGVIGADINALKGWSISTGSKKIKIAVIDTGIDYNHVDLKDNIWTNFAELNGQAGVDDDGNGYIDDIHGYDFANDDGDPMDDNKHGTHVAGTIGAIHNNKIGVAGVMGNVSMVALKFLSATGSGSLANAVKAIAYATKMKVDIMSNSWGGGGFSQTMKDAISVANDAGILFVAAAGNSGSNNDLKPQYPSSYQLPNIISVAALTAQNELASFSCYGKKTVHIAAPGHRILSTLPSNKYGVLSGTSMATPHVSGALGLLLSINNTLTVQGIREQLMMTSVPVSSLRGKTTTAGRMDVLNLLENNRPYRNIPQPSKWVTVKLDQNWQSSHPYLKNTSIQTIFKIPGAKFIRVKIKKYDIETKYDFLQVSNQKRTQIEKIWGKGTEFFTDYIAGDTAYISFKSDNSVNKWGFLINEVEVQY